MNSNPFDTSEDVELRQRLGLYQVFQRLYEQHRDLLDEILNLENSGSRALSGVTSPYIQGMVLQQQVYLVTNLFKGKTQALTQPQNIWTIGRDSQQVIVPIQDKRLSRCHAAIRYSEAEGFQLIDLNSSNGSYINGELIRHAAPLKDGDRIRLGTLSFAFFVCQAVQTLNDIPADKLALLQTTRSEMLQRQRPTPETIEANHESGDRIASTKIGDTLLFPKPKQQS